MPLLNEYFSLLTEITFRHDGTVFHMAGDCLMLGFGVPLEQKDSSTRAVRTAREMLDGFSNLALVRTGDGVREWTYYARSGHEFLERMKAVLPGHPQFAGKVLVEVAADPGWSAYEDFRGHLQR